LADRSAIIDAVVIGRNEGPRLLACLASLKGQVRRIVYVDSGSKDRSVIAAREAGAMVVPLDMTKPFTAARARNAGIFALAEDSPDFVQLIDGDCTLDPDWIGKALAGFAAHPLAVVICGRRRERFPRASVYNSLTDHEWNTPIGKARACGGDALFKFAPLFNVGGFRDDLIAGEEPELCLRLRRMGGEVWRIDAEMTLHDAALTRFGQWWKRMVRSGHAFAEGAALHGATPEQHWVKETNRAIIWGAVMPVILVVGGLLHPLWGGLVLIYPLQMIRLAARDGFSKSGWQLAFFTVIGRLAEAQGALGYYFDRLSGRRRGLIEYK
jgi:glycosyltransferase involved in cell wall biosynthesis